jgi:hypothetical protein
MTLYEKIAKVQDDVQNISKDADNPFFKSKYATYEKVIETVYPVMRKYKLMSLHSFTPSAKENHLIVTTDIRDLESDSFWGSQLEIPLAKNDPQSAGSAITYAKRYALLAMLGLGTEDDDGNVASNPPQASKPQYSDPYATDAQLNLINKMIKQGSIDEMIGKEIPSMTRTRASEVIQSGMDKFNNKGKI